MSQARRLTRAQQREQTRTRVLDAAEELFAREGYSGAALDEIAEAAGYSKGAVYSNFSGKDDLFLALMRRRAERGAEAEAGGDGGPVVDPSGWALATLDFFLTAVRKPELREALARGYQETRQQLGPTLAAQGGGAWATPDELATLAMALGSGLIIQAALDPEAVADDLYARALDRLLSGDAH